MRLSLVRALLPAALLHPAARPRAPGAPLLCAANAAKPARLMVVDDQEGLRSAVHRYLSHNGFHCDAYRGAAEALDALVKGAVPDLIVTDVMMQGVDGYQLLRRVRADPRLGGVPVVLLTAKGFAADRIAGFDAGASAYVSKPFEPEELLSVINAMLLNARLAQAATVSNELHTLKQEVASIKQLLQALVKVEGAPAQLRAAPGELATVPGALPPPPFSSALADGGVSFAAPGGMAPLRPPPPKLTNRERTILDLVGEGKLNREIAEALGVSKGFVEKYIKRLLDKTKTTNRTELVRRSLQMGLLPADSPYTESPYPPAATAPPVVLQPAIQPPTGPNSSQGPGPVV